MGDPAGAAAHVRQSLKPDDAWMVMPMAKNIGPTAKGRTPAMTSTPDPAVHRSLRPIGPAGIPAQIPRLAKIFRENPRMVGALLRTVMCRPVWCEQLHDLFVRKTNPV
jgi:hypothetical protein